MGEVGGGLENALRHDYDHLFSFVAAESITNSRRQLHVACSTMGAEAQLRKILGEEIVSSVDRGEIITEFRAPRGTVKGNGRRRKKPRVGSTFFFARHHESSMLQAYEVLQNKTDGEP